ncbi:MFS transporter, partial [Burkholderia pseudomallei]|nr:MFS transporter [Burkholderia pseudomallei]MBF3912719.1 MFS transporter [Burkholderia pseudomallei]
AIHAGVPLAKLPWAGAALAMAALALTLWSASLERRAVPGPAGCA